MRKRLRAWLIGVVVVLAVPVLWFFSLFAHPAYRPARLSFCEVTTAHGWTAAAGGSSASIKVDGVEYVVSVSAFEPSITPADDTALRSAHGNAMLVEFSGLTVGQSVGWRAPAMRYSAADAGLQLAERHVSALPVLWQRQFLRDRSDSNGNGWGLFEVGPSVVMNGNRAPHDPFVLVFPVKPARPGDSVVFLPGRIELDGRSYPLPGWKMCTNPGGWYVWRFRG
jgi:hypothetical protein